jgi:hypothetical protein
MPGISTCTTQAACAIDLLMCRELLLVQEDLFQAVELVEHVMKFRHSINQDQLLPLQLGDSVVHAGDLSLHHTC